VSEFVEACRHEWKRLGVPDGVVDEMAAELEADLEEAEAEGATADEVLGRGAFDPPSFAAAWAGERGVVQQRRWRSRVPSAIATFALVPAIIGAVLLIAASPSGPQRLKPFSPDDLAVWIEATPVRAPAPAPPPPPTAANSARARARAAADDAGRQADYARLAHASAVLEEQRALIIAGNTSGASNDTRTAGTVLLIVGLAGIVPLTLFWLWSGDGRRREAGKPQSSG
jgi:hypothetical protein